MATPTFETILYDVEDGIATFTLNRPDRMNAFTGQMMADMIAAFDATDADDAVGAVIVTGAGKAFCAGADLAAGGATFDHTASTDPRRREARVGGVQRDGGGRLTLRIYQSLKPVISAVNGAAVGVGVTMQLPMDIRLASTAARFGFVFARRGITPEAASSWFLPRLVGMQTALEWCYTGRVFGAEEAKERGLVRSLHAPEDLIPAAKALAREIIDNTATGVDRPDPPDALAHDRRRPADGSSSRRQPRHPISRRLGRCSRRRDLISGKAARALSQPRFKRSSRYLASLDVSRVQLRRPSLLR